LLTDILKSSGKKFLLTVFTLTREKMRMKITCIWQMAALVILLSVGSDFTLYGGQTSLKINPFRVALVIGDQWKDPAGYLVDLPAPTGEYSGYDATPAVQGDQDFHHLVVLLKSWGIPFDIIRLDQQILDRYMFLDMHNKPKYGTILWDVNTSDKILQQDYTIITEMIRDYGIGMIAISDRISQEEIQNLLGLKYKGGWESNGPLTVKNKHYITEGLTSPFIADSGTIAHMKRQQVELLEGAEAIAEQGSYPQVTVKTYPSGSHLVWIGHDHDFLFSFQSMRTLLRRAITWSIGYNIFKTWENNIIMIMDDPGGASNNYLEHWHYPVLTEDIIQKYLIAPLVSHKAVLNINFVPGFVNDGKKMMEPTWKNNFIDPFGTKQDYISSKRGYDKGVEMGVFEVMCHGLTHMQPDLVSAPGWYGAPSGMEKSEVGWYREFGDTRRLGEIPAAEQLWRMNTAIDWIKEQFGVVPLEFCPGGLGSSVSYFNNTAKVAGRAGFGWNGWESGYLGSDMVVTGWKYFGTPESPLMVAAPPDAHDFGISRSPEQFATIFGKYPKGRFISINEYIGYLHSKISAAWNSQKNSLAVMIEYDPHYCRYFETHDSYWNLEFSDWMKLKTGGSPSVFLDGKTCKISDGKINIPVGAGKHEMILEF
jgi:hypothetical protein